MRRLLSLFAILAFGSVSAEATSYVMMHDATLVDQAPEIVRVRIESRENDPSGPRTLYRATVLETLKGSVGPEITLSVPGGTNDAGMTWKVFGVPSFEPGDEALVFASYRDDGTWSPFQLMLGTFHEKTVDGSRVAMRDLSEATEMGRAVGADEERARSSARFTRWIQDRLAGNDRPADYFVELESRDMQSSADAFTLMVDGPSQCGTGLGIRFFEFDSGEAVDWLLNANGTPLTPNIVKQSLAAWNNEPQTPLKLHYAGTTTSTAAFSDFDFLNAVTGGDPQGDISGPYSCGSGGTLAIGGPWYDCERVAPKNFNGKLYHKAFGADIVTSKGSDCFFNDPVDAAEVITHELGHALGIGHSCGDSGSPSCQPGSALDDATMNAIVHQDGRGAAIRSDDIAALRHLYRADTGSGGMPAAPTELAAEPISTTQIQLTWKDQSTNENKFLIERKDLGSVFGTGGSAATTGDFNQIAEAQANQESFQIDGLNPANYYAFRVRARNANGDSPPSNEISAATYAVTGPCVEDATTLCLNNDRFQVTATWETAADTGTAFAKELTADTGYFYFFKETNVEVVSKVLPNCGKSQSGYFWVFLSGLTDQGVRIVVIDSETGEPRIYENTLGVPFVFRGDTTAFACE